MANDQLLHSDNARSISLEYDILLGLAGTFQLPDMEEKVSVYKESDLQG